MINLPESVIENRLRALLLRLDINLEVAESYVEEFIDALSLDDTKHRRARRAKPTGARR